MIERGQMHNTLHDLLITAFKMYIDFFEAADLVEILEREKTRRPDSNP